MAKTIEQLTAEQIGKEVHSPDGHGVIVGGDYGTGRWNVLLEDGSQRVFEGPQLHEITPTVTGRTADRDTFVVGFGAKLIRGAQVFKYGTGAWEILTDDGWQRIRSVQFKPHDSILIVTQENRGGWFRSTNLAADTYLSQVRPAGVI